MDKFSMTWRVTPDLLGVLDDTGLFVDTNPAWLNTLGWHAHDIESRPFFDFLHPDDLAKTRQAFIDISNGCPILNFENRYRHKDGSYRWLSWNAVPEGRRYFCSARDITEHKINSATLSTREEEAVLREQFIGILGHDLRNPLAAISASARMLARDPSAQDKSELLEGIQGSVDRMSALITDLMDFTRSRLGGGIILDARASVELLPVLHRAVEEIRLAHPQARLETRLDFDDPVCCDAGRIAQLVSNLLANAVAHGEPGSAIRLIAKDRDDEFLIRVDNEGPEISPATQDRMFEPFFGGHAAENRNGLGLGLFICAQIAKAHGGQLHVDRQDDINRFTFRMPRTTSTVAEPSLRFA